MILDAGALVAVDRNDRAMIARLLAAHQSGEELRTHPMVVAQVWCNGRRQAQLAKVLKAVDIVSIDDNLGRRSGVLLGDAGMADPIDAAVVLLAHNGDTAVTSDPEDINSLANAAGIRINVVRC